jgi:hypothetical protein
MAVVLASDVLLSARDVLLDNGSGPQTWTDASLLRWLNEALAAAVTLKRDIAPAVLSLALVPGSVQGLPAGVVQILEPYFNTVSGNAVTKGGMTLLNRRFPTWRSNPATVDVSDVTTDERSPVIFHVFPPNTGGGAITALCGTLPTCTILASPVVVPDHYRSALVDGVCAMAMAANTRRRDVTKTAFFWQRFEAGIMGAKIAQHETAPKLSDAGQQ